MDGNNVIYKVYDENDVYLGVIDDVFQPNDVSIPNEINSTGTAIQITLARNADSTAEVLDTFITNSGDTLVTNNGYPISAQRRSKNKIGPDSIIQYNNRVDVVLAVGQNDNLITNSGDNLVTNSGDQFIAQVAGDGEVEFTGFISNIGINYGGDENTVITVTSFGYDLDQYVIMNGAKTDVTFNSEDPSDILKAALDAFVADGGRISYDGSSIADTGTSVSYPFKVNTYKEVIQKCLELAPSDWYYYLRLGQGLIYFQERPSTPNHYFYLGKHIESMNVDGNILDVVNDVFVIGGETLGVPLFTRSTVTPDTQTRRGLRRLNDGRVKDLTSAGIIADGEINRYNKILYTTSITIFASEYPIGSIRIGQLVGFRNFDNFVDNLELQIVRTVRHIDRIDIELGTLLPKVSKRIEDIKRNLTLAETSTVPDEPS